MDFKETVFFWLAALLYVLSALLAVSRFAFGRPAKGKIGEGLLWAGFVCHGAAIIFRWAATGHPPVIKNYENAVAGAWGVILFLLVVGRRNTFAEPISLILVPFALLMMGYGVMNAPQLEPNRPVFRTPWLAVHIIFAWAAYSAFVAAFGAGVVYLVREKRFRRLPPAEERAAGLEALDELASKLIVFGFISSTIMLLAGSIWASKLWGSYWGWDPIETWSLISWLIYGIYLHLRFTFKWKGKVMAWIAVAAMLTVIISFWGVNLIMSTLHNFQNM